MRLEVTLNDEPLVDFLKRIQGPLGMWVVVNEQRLGSPLACVDKQTSDLFEAAPEEMRATDSLHICSMELNESTCQAVRQAGQADGALLILSSKPLPELLEAQKFVWAWYIKPSLVEFQMMHGSKNLAHKLLEAIETVVLVGPSDHDVVLLAPDAASESLQALLNSKMGSGLKSTQSPQG